MIDSTLVVYSLNQGGWRALRGTAAHDVSDHLAEHFVPDVACDLLGHVGERHAGKRPRCHVLGPVLERSRRSCGPVHACRKLFWLQFYRSGLDKSSCIRGWGLTWRRCLVFNPTPPVDAPALLGFEDQRCGFLVNRMCPHRDAPQRSAARRGHDRRSIRFYRHGVARLTWRERRRS